MWQGGGRTLKTLGETNGENLRTPGTPNNETKTETLNLHLPITEPKPSKSLNLNPPDICFFCQRKARLYIHHTLLLQSITFVFTDSSHNNHK